MDLKLCLVLLAAVCLAQVRGGPVTKDLADDTEHAQYAVVKFATELSIFRMRAHSLALEVNYTVKVIDRQIIALMEVLEVDAATLDTVKSEMTNKGTMILDNILDTMRYSDGLVELLNEINNDIVNNPARLQLDLYIMNTEMNNLNRAYEQGRDIVVLAIENVELRIDGAIVGIDAPEVAEIRALMAQAKEVLMEEQALINGSKAIVDKVALTTREALQALIDQQAPVLTRSN